MKKQIYSVIIIVLGLIQSVCGQPPTTISISKSSPNAESLGFFGNNSANASIGAPNIDVALYSVQYNGTTVPINLKYSTNLVKPDSHPGWVGLGWNLFAGGSITRSVNDQKDETTYSSTGSLFTVFDWMTESKIKAATQQRVSGVYKDTEADEFSFAFLGFSGSFYLDENKQWTVKCDQHLQVKFDNEFTTEQSGSERSFKKFTLIDPQGIQYVFGGDDAAIEWNNALNDGSSVYLACTWNLTKIIMPNNEGIDFAYEQGETIVAPVPAFRFSTADPDELVYSGTFIRPSYLKSISTKFESITFSRSLSVELPYKLYLFSNSFGYFGYGSTNSSNYQNYNFFKLDNIVVKNKSSGKSVKFDFSYTNNTATRLKLLGITESGGDFSTSNRKWTFYYNQLSLPPYFSMKTDFWGFYNNTPPDYSSQSNFNSSRVVNPTYLQAEVINKVTYPTGGYSVYTFEPHTYAKELAYLRWQPLIVYSQDVTASGLRINKIESFGKDNILVGSKRFVYQSNYSNGIASGLSTGILGGKTEFPFQPPTAWIQLVNQLPTVENVKGSNIAYSKVTEIDADGGYTQTTFSNFDNGNSNEYMDAPPIFSLGFDWRGLGFISKASDRGFPLKVTTFSNNDQPLQDHTWAYTRVNELNRFLKAYKLKWTQRTYVASGVVEILSYDGKSTKVLTYSYLPTSETLTSYVNGQPAVSQTKTTTYDPFYQTVKSVSSTNSRGEIVKTEHSYPQDMVSQGRDPSLVYSKMVGRNTINTPVETVTSKNASQTFLSRTDYVEPFTNQFQPNKQSVKYGSNVERVSTHFDSYDSFGNLLTSAKEAAPLTTFIYGYSKMLPIAKVLNASSNECFYEGFEDTGAFGFARTGNRYNKGPYNCTFSAPSGRVYKLTYWYRSVGAASWTFATQTYTGPLVLRQSTTDEIDDVRIFPADAQMVTYTYEPQAGVTSETDANERTTYYEYDELQRLRTVMDNEKSIVKSYCYNYGGQTGGCPVNAVYYYSPTMTGSYTRNNCLPGFLGSQVNYTVPSNKYTSTISQADADRMAQLDLDINGQQYANEAGNCIKIIYARINVKNIYPAQPIYTAEGTQQDTYGDVYVQFFTDPGCSIPFTLTENINLSVDYKLTDQTGVISQYVTPFTAMASTTESSLWTNIRLISEMTGYYNYTIRSDFTLMPSLASPIRYTVAQAYAPY